MNCLGGFNQNKNESLNQLIWKVNLKIILYGIVTIKIGIYHEYTVHIIMYMVCAAFNKGNSTLLKMFGVYCGPNMRSYVTWKYDSRIAISEKRVHDNEALKIKVFENIS